jgi:hypothetical protein
VVEGRASTNESMAKAGAERAATGRDAAAPFMNAAFVTVMFHSSFETEKEKRGKEEEYVSMVQYTSNFVFVNAQKISPQDPPFSIIDRPCVLDERLTKAVSLLSISGLVAAVAVENVP